MVSLQNCLGFGLVMGAVLLGGGGGCGSDSSSAGGGTGGAGTGGGGGAGGQGKTFDAGTDPARNNVTAGQICQRLAEIQCAGEAYCCDSPGRTETDCITAQKKACTDTNLDAIAADPVAGFDATKAATAFTEFERLASICDANIAAYAASPTGLRGIVQGTVAAGGTCTPTAPSDPINIAASLASCLDPAAQACMTAASGAWTCKALAGDGGACFSDVNCTTGLYCDNPTYTFAGGTCKARKTAGTSCQLSNECASFSCTVATHTCAAPGVQTAYCLKQ